MLYFVSPDPDLAMKARKADSALVGHYLANYIANFVGK